MIRAFIGVELGAATIANIASAIEQLKPRIPGIRWVRPDHFHVTLKFLGDIDESKINPAGAALSNALHPFPCCTINAKGLGVFPSPMRPRVLWVGLDGPELILLAAHVESALAPLGFAPEERNFTPHLTIGRWRQIDRAGKTLDQELAKWRNFEFGISQVNEVILFQSVLKPTGAIYTRLIAAALKHETDRSREGGGNGLKS